MQDKGSRLVLESKERYNELMLKYLEDKSIFREDQEDQSQTNIEKVHKWVKTWERREQLGTEEVEWISDVRSLPAKVYANIKTHKDGWPYRYIVLCNQTVVETLARWVEYQLRYLYRNILLT